MALNKDFKVKDTITVGASGWFGNTVQIGTHNDYISVDPALTVWGPILSGGIDLAEFIGDGVDGIYEGDSAAGQGTIKYQTQSDAQFNPSVFTHVDVLGLGQNDSPTFTNLTLSGDNLTVEGASFSLSGNSTTTVLSGASEIIIDPAGYGTGGNLEAGTVRIAGDLIVDGDTFTVNSTTVSLSDTVIQLGNSEDGGITANGNVPVGGIGIQAGTMTGASILYKGTAGWEINGSDGTEDLTSLINFKVGAGGADYFQVDAANGNVTTQGSLTVNSTTTLSGDLVVKTDGDVQKFKVTQTNGNTDIEGTLNVAGTATFEQTQDNVAIASTGSVTISGDLRVDDYTDADTNYFLVDNSDGLTTISDLTVTDLTEDQIVLPSSTGNLEGDANFTFNGTQLNIGQGKLTVQQGSGNIHSEGNLTLVGSSTLSGDVTVKNSGTDDTKLTIANASGDLTTTGTITLSGDLVVNDSGAGDTNWLTVDNSSGETTIASATISDLTDNKIVIAGTSGSLESGNIQDTGTMVTIETALNVDGAATFDTTVEIDGATTVNNTVTLSGNATTASSVEYVYVGSAVATGAAPSYTQTLPVANLNAAKFIVAVDDGATGKSVIELLVARDDSGDLDGTAYGQVDVGTAQISDIDISESGSTVGITVTGTDGAAVTVFGTGYYN